MSILDDIKLDLGIPNDYDVFDPTVKRHINTAFSRLAQLGVGPPQGFKVVDDSTTWDAILTDDSLEDVKAYVFLRVKMLFDPPGTSFVIAAMEKQLEELAWTINVKKEGEEWTQPPPK